MQLNEKLSMLRKNNNYSTRELAEKLGVSQSSISLWEKGERKPDYENIVKLSSIYGVTTDFLLGSQMLGEKSKLQELNEQRNLVMSRISLLDRDIRTLTKKIDNCYSDILTCHTFLHQVIQHKSKKNVEAKRLDEKLEKLIQEKNAIISSDLGSLEKQKEELNKEKEHLQAELGFIINQCSLEEQRITHMKINLSSLDSLKFQQIKIQSEYELQTIILKYLDLYYIFEQSNLDINEFISKLKLHVHSDFWSNR